MATILELRMEESEVRRGGAGDGVQGIEEGLGVGEGEDAVGGVANGFIGGGVVAGGEVLRAHFLVEALPFGESEVADGLLRQGAAEILPGGAEAGGGGIEGLGPGEEGGVEGVGGAAAGAIGAQVQAADAAIGGEGDPERFVFQGRAESGPFHFQPFADGEFVFDGVFAAAGGVDEPLVGVFDAQVGIGRGLGEEVGRVGIRRSGAGGKKEGQQPREFHGSDSSGGK